MCVFVFVLPVDVEQSLGPIVLSSLNENCSVKNLLGFESCLVEFAPVLADEFLCVFLSEEFSYEF